MLKKFAFVMKYLALSFGILVGIISCENDLKDIGVNLVDNNVFSTNKYMPEIIAYSNDIENNQTNGLVNYLLGVQRDAVFGKIEASVVGQLTLAKENPDFGLNAVIDSVIVDIPLRSHEISSSSRGSKEFELDSVWTKGNASFQLNVYELGTYLNVLNPIDPTQSMEYFSDDVFIKKNPSLPLFSGLVSPSAVDTVTYVKRYSYPNYPDLSERIVFQTDTIKKNPLAPSLKISFDEDYIKSVFLDAALGSDFASNANFQYYFRGLYFEALESSLTDAALMMLEMSKTSMTIYYSYDVIKDEDDDEDLDGDGINGENGVHVRTPESLVFLMSGIKANLYNRDITGSQLETMLNNANTIEGESRLYVQGAAGSNAVLKLFGEDANENGVPDELETIRNNNWLINDARLSIYIDKENTTDWTPERLYLYNIKEEENTQLQDAMPQALVNIGGFLVRDSDKNPEKYVFSLREYITELVKPDSDMIFHDLGLKVYDGHDTPSNTTLYDTIVRKYDTNPKGIVLKGNLPITDEQRVQLEIFYSKEN